MNKRNFTIHFLCAFILGISFIPSLNAAPLAIKKLPSLVTAADQDLDGVPDSKDKCAKTPSRVAVDTQGCPLNNSINKDKKQSPVSQGSSNRTTPGMRIDNGLDQDRDGIPTPTDQCPATTFGMLVNADGCTVFRDEDPNDRDMDGVSGNQDLCPNLRGSEDHRGCPDTDGDGHYDHEDSCVNEAGTTSWGCPDQDGDRIDDREDLCPDQAGVFARTQFETHMTPHGCPHEGDIDGDAVINQNDYCPMNRGDASARGCPDRDGDRLADQMDQCPDVVGDPIFGRGCPDTDQDGIADNDDRCPQQGGVLIDYDGCPSPDSDGDGFSDTRDFCRQEPGTVHGCPDRDGDNIEDRRDLCPDQAGVPERGIADNYLTPNGCTHEGDIDGDEVINRNDYCPMNRGDASARGCPDRDGDGFRDEVDPCPDVVGDSIIMTGCPDTDQDRVADNVDRCPQQGGALIDYYGCPK